MVLLGFVIYKETSKPNDKETKNVQQTNNSPAQNSAEDQESNTTWTGTLKHSNAAANGNLMLLFESSDDVVYIRTSRDFSALIDKPVEVTIEGNLANFKLLDIKPIE